MTRFLSDFIAVSGALRRPVAWAAAILLIGAVGLVTAQTTRTISLEETIRLAAAQSPEVQLARIDAEKSVREVALIRAERSPQLYAGSGLGYTEGIPQSIEGATPSVAQLTAKQPLFDQSRNQRIRQAEALSQAAELGAETTRELLVYQVALLYLDFELGSRRIDQIDAQVEQFTRIEEIVRARIDEGREIPLALSRVALDRKRAESRLNSARRNFDLIEADLKRRLDLDKTVRLKPAPSGDLRSIDTANTPLDADEASRRAVADSPELAAIDARLRSKGFQEKAAKGARYPKLDFVGQYALLARFNNYDEFFNRFQRHNWQAGVAFQVPLFAGRGVGEQVAKARLEARELTLERKVKLQTLELEGLRAYESVSEAQNQSELARLELEYARENLDVLLAQFEEGQLALDTVDRARVVESAAWEWLYESQHAVDSAKLALLHSMGELTQAFGD